MSKIRASCRCIDEPGSQHCRIPCDENLRRLAESQGIVRQLSEAEEKRRDRIIAEMKEKGFTIHFDF